MTVNELICKISEKYWEHGYIVSEICIPTEWKKELDAENEKDGAGLVTNFVLDDSNVVKVFDSPSRHLQIIVRCK